MSTVLDSEGQTGLHGDSLSASAADERFHAALGDHQQIGAALSKLVSASIGDICLVMSRSPAHKHYVLADIEWMILPPVLAGQFYLADATAEKTGMRAPVAVVTWARVSPDVDARLRATAGQPARLRPDEWTSGDIHWLIDIVGEQRGVGFAFRWLLDGAFKGTPAHMIVRRPDGQRSVETLQALIVPEGPSR